MLVSKPACEKRQMSAATVPEEGRTSGIGFPASVQVFVEVVNKQIAATSRSRLASLLSSTAVVGSTTVMSLPVAAGGLLVIVITSSLLPGVTITRSTTFDVRASGCTICTLRFPAEATSLLLTGAVQKLELSHVVMRAVPPICSTEPGPG